MFGLFSMAVLATLCESPFFANVFLAALRHQRHALKHQKRNTMIYKYGIKVKGAYHKRVGTPCQDAQKIVRCGDDMVIAAVADGLGACIFSHIGSSKAVQVSTRYCKNHITRSSSSEDILRIIKASFFEAKNEIEKTADIQGNELKQYHTTLSLWRVYTTLDLFSRNRYGSVWKWWYRRAVFFV